MAAFDKPEFEDASLEFGDAVPWGDRAASVSEAVFMGSNVADVDEDEDEVDVAVDDFGVDCDVCTVVSVDVLGDLVSVLVAFAATLVSVGFVEVFVSSAFVSDFSVVVASVLTEVSSFVLVTSTTLVFVVSSTSVLTDWTVILSVAFVVVEV